MQQDQAMNAGLAEAASLIAIDPAASAARAAWLEACGWAHGP